MYLKRMEGPNHVVLPDGSRMTRSDLPPRDTVRWVARRKAAVVRPEFGTCLPWRY